MPGDTGSPSTIEHHSIDYIPESERHGKAWHLGPLWFAVNANLTILATGVFGLLAGANLFWSMVAALTGVSVGTFFMASHSAQGPQLGMPQMVQSRAQFGYRGALVVVPGVLIMYIGYNILNTQLAAEATNVVIGDFGGGALPPSLLYILLLVLVLIVAVVGYNLIHVVQRVLTVLFLIVFGTLTIGALFTIHLSAGAMNPNNGFVWLAFLSQFSIAAASQMGWAPYVADYSRYLPKRVGLRATFWWTYAGSLFGAVWMMWLGALLMSAVGLDASPVTAVHSAAQHLFAGFGPIVLIVAIPGLLAVTTVNTYCAGLTLLTVSDSIRPLKATTTKRVLSSAIIAVATFAGASYASENFLATFQNLIVIMLYCFIPWTSINLLDFYVIRRGRYEIKEMFKPDGVYGKWNWRGLVTYVATIVIMVPFFSIGDWYTGSVAERLGGIDIAMFVGLPIGAIIYYILNRYGSRPDGMLDQAQASAPAAKPKSAPALA